MKKLPVCPICSGPHYAYSCWRNPKRKSAFKAHFKAVEARQKKKIHKDPSSTENRRKTLIYKLDLVVSRYARQLYADKNGICTCYTCGKRIPWKAGDIGHCISRRYINTRFDLDNLRFQCQECNRVLHGNYKVYYPKLEKELGQEKYQKMWQKARSGDKISTPELEILLEKYNNLLKTLKK